MRPHPPATPDPPLVEALLQHYRSGNHPAAEQLARTLSQRWPHHPLGWKILAATLLNQGRPHEALPAARHAVSCSPHDPEIHHTLGTLLQSQGERTAAASAFQRAVELRPDFVEALTSLGAALKGLGRLTEAAQPLHRALQLRPDHPPALNNLGSLLQEQGESATAEPYLRRALQLKPDYPLALNNLGLALSDLERWEEAEAAFSRALQLDPTHPLVLNNLGTLLHSRQRLTEAASLLRRGVELHPNSPDLHHNLGRVLEEQGALEEAETSVRRSLELAPHRPATGLMLGFILLLTGRWREGWPYYELRWEGADTSKRTHRPATPLPQWRGEPPSPGSSLLVFCEQGLGDSLQFSRYLLTARERFARVGCVTPPPLQRLFTTSFAPEITILATPPVESAGWEWHAPLLSLPLAFGVTPERLNGPVRYLHPDPELVTTWRERLTALDSTTGTPPRLRVGIAWAGNPGLSADAQRSIPLALLTPLLAVPEIAWVVLQHRQVAEPPPVTCRWHDWMNEIGDFADTAALVTQLDLVITVDTAVAHLAGGIGTPTWLLNRHGSEWRWLRGREETPWYPTMRIFTQLTAGEWNAVLHRVAAELAGFHPESARR